MIKLPYIYCSKLIYSYIKNDINIYSGEINGANNYDFT